MSGRYEVLIANAIGNRSSLFHLQRRKGLSRKLKRWRTNRLQEAAKNSKVAMDGECEWGDCRVIYSIDDGQVLVVVVDVDHRRDVYR